MPKKKTLTVASKVIRHMPQFSRLATIPLEKVASWKLDQTTDVEGTINGVEAGRRSMKRWDDRNCWWIDLPDPLCKKAKIDTGDSVELQIWLASEDLPEELQNLLNENKSAKAR
ncbi:MAG TPA: hypothetical protein VGQ39_04060, partial [Pyrinomonadaceae bacterium]|nr:hypothetical protein [Pyrinomonadaceae bacterium]